MALPTAIRLFGNYKACAEQGAKWLFTYQGDQFKNGSSHWQQKSASKPLIDCDDVSNMDDLDRAFHKLKKEFGTIDFIVHSIAFSNKEELKGRYVDTSLDNFLLSMNILLFLYCCDETRSPVDENGGSAITHILRRRKSYAEL